MNKQAEGSSAGLQPCISEAKASRYIASRIDLLFVVFIFSLSFFTSICYAQNEERLTLTTYYPAPYGTYQQLAATEKFYVGPTGSVSADLAAMTAGDAVFMGRVGIGTTSPGNRLDVSGGDGIGAKISVGQMTQAEGSTQINAGTYNLGRSYFNSTWDDNLNISTFDDTPNPSWTIGIGDGAGGWSGNKYMMMNATGNVGIGITGPNRKLEIAREGNNTEFSLNENLFLDGRGGTVRITNNAYVDSSGSWAISDAGARASTIEIRDTGVVDIYGTLTAGLTDWRQIASFDALNNRVRLWGDLTVAGNSNTCTKVAYYASISPAPPAPTNCPLGYFVTTIAAPAPSGTMVCCKVDNP